jgi:hypothetical protein
MAAGLRPVFCSVAPQHPYSTWHYVTGGLFGVAFIAALLGLFFSSVNATVLVTVITLMSGALLLVLVLPRVLSKQVGII